MPESLYLPCSFEIHVMAGNVPVLWSEHRDEEDALATAKARAAAGDTAHLVTVRREVSRTIPASLGRAQAPVAKARAMQ